MMEPIHIALLVLGVLVVGLIVAALIYARSEATSDTPIFVLITGGIISLVLFVIVGFLAVMPEYRLWRASIEKRILVEEARAQADSAVELARAEIERAKGTAEANEIVAETITEPYLRYLYINQLDNTSNQVIYLPTEAGLPILEADRFEQDE